MNNFFRYALRRIFKATVAPAVATEGDLYYDTTAHAAYVATGANTWSVIDTGSVGTVTRVTGTSPISVANSTTTPNITLGTVPASKGGTGNTGPYTKGDLLTSTGAAALTALGVGSDGQILTADSLQADGIKWSTPATSTTNSAGANVVPKSDGVNLVASQITDDGNGIVINSSNANKSTNIYGEGSGSINVGDGLKVNLGDWQGNANGTKLVIDDANQTITNTAAGSMLNITPLWGAGSDGAKFQISGSEPDDGSITKYRGSPPGDGQILIGNASTGSLRLGALTPGTGISVTNGAGSITIAQDPLTTGAPLSCLVSNTVLAAATGTVYSSPGYGGTPLAAATEAAVGWAVPRAGTINALQVYSGTTAKVNTPSTVVTVRKNGVDTALTLTLTQTVSTLSNDNTHTFTVARGDIITVSFTTTGAASVSTSIAGVSFLLN